jgi:hypothetical protein
VTALTKIDLPVLGGALRLKLRVNTWYEMYLSIDSSEVFLGASSQRELSDRLSAFLHESFTPWRMVLALSETYVRFYPVAIKPSGPQILMLQDQHGKPSNISRFVQPSGSRRCRSADGTRLITKSSLAMMVSAMISN